ncbi:MAG: prepilin-type N-terminal cleavage/methylation domain-containing protein [Gammaproteobacteria bacterium]|nr:prepilin-type N-terminal cleavage/methylation domain-containing protein [Gammaproteobacteria bacterium]
MNKQHKSGFTLVELMVVIAIAGILAAVAIPSYNSYITKSRRADAHATLMDLQAKQEKYRANNPTYAGTAQMAAAGIAATSADGYYAVTVSGVNTAVSYEGRATALGSQLANDTDCRILIVNQNGDKWSINSASGVATTTNTPCW